jgi:DNA polymerase bacteriophage-type
MRELSIDLETFSNVNLKTHGIYKYVEALDFEIILFAWAFDDEEIQVVSNMNKLPQEVLNALNNPKIIKTAFNAAFEIAAIQAHFGITLDPFQWSCTMVKAAMLGLPLSLDAVGRALNLETTKDATGKALIKFFCFPCKPTKTNGMINRNTAATDLPKWVTFEDYCKIDVQQERLIKNKLSFFKPSDEEIHIWVLDQQINSRGIEVDKDLINAALSLAEEHKNLCMNRAVELTGLQNPGSVAQVKGWMEAAIGESIESLNKKSLPALRKKIKGTAAEEVLKLREQLSKTSVKKYEAMEKMVCDDGRVKGLVQYYGAGRTGRWAGRGIQVHNLPRNSMQLLDEAREIVKTAKLDDLAMLWDSPPDVLSQLIRTAFVAKKDHILLGTDFSAIEARVTAWLAGESWRMDVFKTHGKIYEASASTMFKVPIDSISYKDKNGEVQKGPNYKLRQNGKVAELALGFGGGPVALINMGALDMDFMIEFVAKCKKYWESNKAELSLSYGSYDEFKDAKVMGELAKLVRMWRNANKRIQQYWSDINEAAITAVLIPGSMHKLNNISFYVKNNILWCKLPSGRCLTYQDPKLVPGKFGGHSLTYLGVDQFTKRWSRLSTYGGKLVENIVQATARDLLAYAMLRLNKQGFKIVMHVHDEVVIELPEKFAASSVIAVNKIMSQRPDWAPGLPLSAESFITKYYKKD